MSRQSSGYGLFVCAILYILCVLGWSYGQTTQPSGLDSAFAQIQSLVKSQQDQVGSAQLDAQIANAKLAVANAQLNQLQGQYNDATATLKAQAQQINMLSASFAALHFVIPGTDIAPIINAGKAGTYHCMGAKYPCNGSPTMRTDQRWIGDDGAEIDFTPVPGAAAVVLECQHGGFENFKFVRLHPEQKGGTLRIRGVGRVGGIKIADGFPLYYPQGNFVRDCEFDSSVAQIMVHGTAVGTLISNNLFHNLPEAIVYDCGLHTVVTYNRFPEGSQGEHCYRQERDGNLYAEDSVLAFNWFDNRSSPTKKEDVTFREGLGGIAVGNVMLSWASQGQTASDGLPHGSPAFFRSNIFPNNRENLVNGKMQYGALIQSDIGSTVYCDNNWFPTSANASAVTVYAVGNLITRANNLVYPLPVYKQALAVLGVGSTPFKGNFLQIADSKGVVDNLVFPPATQPTTVPSTQPTTAPATLPSH